jgi:hypothetical protein
MPEILLNAEKFPFTSYDVPSRMVYKYNLDYSERLYRPNLWNIFEDKIVCSCEHGKLQAMLYT